MSDGEHLGYTRVEWQYIAGMTLGLTVGPLVASPYDGWGIERFAFALVCGTLAFATGLLLYRS